MLRTILAITAGLAFLATAAPWGYGQTGLEQFETSLKKLVRETRPLVVSLTSHHEAKDGDGPTFLRGKYRFSGILISAEGHVVTVAHALYRADRIEARLLGGRVLLAKPVASDRLTNVAVVKIDGDDLPFIKEVSSGDVEVGSFVIAVGNPFGLHHSVATGIVSGTDRSIRTRRSTLKGMIQTTTPINPGDAGGLLVDSRGRFVGMITSTFGRAPSFGRIQNMMSEVWKSLEGVDAEFWKLLPRYFMGMLTDEDAKTFEEKYKSVLDKVVKMGAGMGPGMDRGMHPNGRPGGRPGSGKGWRGRSRGKSDGGPESSFGAQGINFVMPGHQVLDIAKALITHGRVVRGHIGATGRPVASLKPETLEKLGLPTDAKGVIIERLSDGGPAAQGGVKKDDLLVTFGGKTVRSLEELRDLVLAARPGTAVEVGVIRGGESMTLKITVAERK